MGKRGQEQRRTGQREPGGRQAPPRPGPESGSGPGSGSGPEQPGGAEPSLQELVESALGAVLYAPPDRYDLVLDQGASALSEPAARWPRTGRTVLVVTGSLLARLWRAGWQPADLVRAVRRELTPRHLRLAVDLIAAETRGYAAAALDPRWSGQLRELEAAVWWGEDDGFLPGVAARERADRFAVATLLLELFRLIGRLPPITLLAPPPGAAGERVLSAPRPGSGSEPRMLGRIRALLAKAESTDFPEEAEALTAKAQQLMAQHSIDEALLAAGAGSGSEPGACRIGIDNPYEAPKAVLLDAVAEANRSRSVWSKDLGFCTVVGFPADLEAVELLPVLAARLEAVQESTDRMFPTLRAGRAVRAGDYEGWTQGRAAADRARLHGHSGALPH